MGYPKKHRGRRKQGSRKRHMHHRIRHGRTKGHKKASR